MTEQIEIDSSVIITALRSYSWLTKAQKRKLHLTAFCYHVINSHLEASGDTKRLSLNDIEVIFSALALAGSRPTLCMTKGCKHSHLVSDLLVNRWSFSKYITPQILLMQYVKIKSRLL